MNTHKFFLLAFVVSLLFVTGSCAQTKPAVTITPNRMFRGGVVEMKGTGFTKNATVLSHLRRPDGTEFPVLPMRTDARGEFAHEIETLLLSPGVHEVWVEDSGSKTTSELVKFEVTVEQK
jgi:hypothetical protein